MLTPSVCIFRINFRKFGIEIKEARNMIMLMKGDKVVEGIKKMSINSCSSSFGNKNSILLNIPPVI